MRPVDVLIDPRIDHLIDLLFDGLNSRPISIVSRVIAMACHSLEARRIPEAPSGQICLAGQRQ
jgi:hypothetical protein